MRGSFGILRSATAESFKLRVNYQLASAVIDQRKPALKGAGDAYTIRKNKIRHAKLTERAEQKIGRFTAAHHRNRSAKASPVLSFQRTSEALNALKAHYASVIRALSVTKKPQPAYCDLSHKRLRHTVYPDLTALRSRHSLPQKITFGVSFDLTYEIYVLFKNFFIKNEKK